MWDGDVKAGKKTKMCQFNPLAAAAGRFKQIEDEDDGRKGIPHRESRGGVGRVKKKKGAAPALLGWKVKPDLF